jgi:hypothetical protein
MAVLLNLGSATIPSQLVFFAKEQLGANNTEVSLLYTAGGTGVVVLSLVASPLRARLPFSRVILGAVTAGALVTIALSLTHQFWVAVPLWALFIGSITFFRINTDSLRQFIVPDELMSRVTSFSLVLAWSATPIGAGLGGLAITWTGNIALVYAVIGLANLLIMFVFATCTALGHADDYLPSSAQAAAPRPGRRSLSVPSLPRSAWRPVNRVAERSAQFLLKRW